jgi:ribosomal protein L37E
MKSPKKLVKDMISSSDKHPTCENCGRELYTHDAKFCSIKCEREYTNKNGMDRI